LATPLDQELSLKFGSIQARRLESLATLAALRKVSLTELMTRLEIDPPDVL